MTTTQTNCPACKALAPVGMQCNYHRRTAPNACDWHGCSEPARFNVRRDIPRGHTFTSLMWTRCAEHMPEPADGLHVSEVNG